MVPSMPVSWVAQTHKKSPEDYARDSTKYVQYFQGNRILPIPELIKEVETKTLSLIITDIKTRRLPSIRKETFEELLRAAGIPAKYFCRRSFATWDVLLPSEELAVKLASNNITSKHFRLQPEYMGRTQIKLTVCNVSIPLREDVIAAYLTEYGDVEDVAKAKSTNGTAQGDHYFTMCLNRTGFRSIPQTLEYKNQTMMVVVEGKNPQCWNCKQLGHFSRTCPEKPPNRYHRHRLQQQRQQQLPHRLKKTLRLKLGTAQVKKIGGPK